MRTEKAERKSGEGCQAEHSASPGRTSGWTKRPTHKLPSKRKLNPTKGFYFGKQSENAEIIPVAGEKTKTKRKTHLAEVHRF
jgi:hypothetical protein